MKTLHFDIPVEVGTILYTAINGKIVEYEVLFINGNFSLNKKENKMNTTITINKGCGLSTVSEISTKDINTNYFIDKKELIQHLVSQL